VELPRTFSINLQLLGGMWILQVFPMIVFGLFTRWFHRWHRRYRDRRGLADSINPNGQWCLGPSSICPPG
jgi:hypothetical protein